MRLSGARCLTQLPLPDSAVLGVIDCIDMPEAKLLEDPVGGIPFWKCLCRNHDGRFVLPSNRDEFRGHRGSETTALAHRESEIGDFNPSVAWRRFEPTCANRRPVGQSKVANPRLVKADLQVEFGSRAKHLACHFRQGAFIAVWRAVTINRYERDSRVHDSGQLTTESSGRARCLGRGQKRPTLTHGPFECVVRHFGPLNSAPRTPPIRCLACSCRWLWHKGAAPPRMRRPRPLQGIWMRPSTQASQFRGHCGKCGRSHWMWRDRRSRSLLALRPCWLP
jgi:hypothetical protein